MKTTASLAASAPLCKGGLYLPVTDTLRASGVLSPYFQSKRPNPDTGVTQEVGTGRDIQLISDLMAVTKAIATQVVSWNQDLAVNAQFYDGNTWVDEYNLEMTDTSQYGSASAIRSYAESKIVDYAGAHSYTAITGAAQIFWVNTPNNLIPQAVSESSLSLSLQTSTGAVGTQISATRDSFVMVNAGITTTATIGGASTGDLVLEVAPTNSATAGDWIEKARLSNSQSISLALVLQSVQVVKGQLIAFVPAGYYAKVRSITGAGSPSYAISSSRQALM